MISVNDLFGNPIGVQGNQIVPKEGVGTCVYTLEAALKVSAPTSRKAEAIHSRRSKADFRLRNMLINGADSFLSALSAIGNWDRDLNDGSSFPFSPSFGSLSGPDR